jgi:hypothetical protein
MSSPDRLTELRLHASPELRELLDSYAELLFLSDPVSGRPIEGGSKSSGKPGSGIAPGGHTLRGGVTTYRYRAAVKLIDGHLHRLTRLIHRYTSEPEAREPARCPGCDRPWPNRGSREWARKARELLEDLFPDPGMELPAEVVLEAATKAEIKETTLRRAKRALEITSHRKAGRWWWTRPYV